MPRRIVGSIRARATACALALAMALAFPGAGPPGLAAQEGPLGRVRTWVYQLDRIDPRAIAASGFDLAVVGYSADGSAESAFGIGRASCRERV